MKTSLLVLTALLVLPLTASALPAPVSSTPIVSGPGAEFTGYATPVATVEVGALLEYTNADVSRHDVRSDAYGSDDQPWCFRFTAGRCPLFLTAIVGLGVTTPLLGTEALEAGKTYTFYCSLHAGMTGTLVVRPEA